MSQCARDMTKFVFSSSLSYSPSWKENVFVPKSNNSFQISRIRGWFSFNFPAGISRYFHCINYLIHSIAIEIWGKCKATIDLKTRSTETRGKLRCRLNRRQHPLQSCAGLSALSLETSGSSVGLGVMASKKQVKCELRTESSHKSFFFFYFGLDWFLCKWKRSKCNYKDFCFSGIWLQECISRILHIHSGFLRFVCLW